MWTFFEPLYMPITSPGKAEIANKKELDILGVGTITLRHTMMDRTLSNITLVQVLYCMFQPQTGDFTLPALLQRRDVKHIGLGTAMMFILQMVQNYESFWFTKLGLVCSPGLAASNFQQFSESIDTVN